MKNRILLSLLIAWFCVGPLYVIPIYAQPGSIGAPGGFVLPVGTIIVGAFAGVKTVSGVRVAASGPGTGACDAGDIFLNSATGVLSFCTTPGTVGAWSGIAVTPITNANISGPLIAGINSASGILVTGNPTSGVGSPTITLNLASGTGIFVSGTNPVTVNQVSNAYTHTNLAALVNVATTSTTVLTQALTMPGLGGPFRIQAHWAISWLAATGTPILTTWLTDGTIITCPVQLGTDPSIDSQDGQTGSCVISATYAAGAAVTISLRSVVNAGNVSATVNDFNNIASGTWLETRVVPQ